MDSLTMNKEYIKVGSNTIMRYEEYKSFIFNDFRNEYDKMFGVV